MDSNSNSNSNSHHHHMQHGQQQEEGSHGGGKAGAGFLCRQSSTRWIPTSDQIRILRDLYYNSGLRSPNADQIQRISARLRQYGKIEGKNVFYWFQNHKARERQKKRLTVDLATAAAAAAVAADTCTKTSFPNRMGGVAGQSASDGGFDAALLAEPNFKDYCVPGRVPAGSPTPPPSTWMHHWHASAANAEMSARDIETLQLFPISTLKEEEEVEVEEEEEEEQAEQGVENYYYYHASNGKINDGQCLVPGIGMHCYSNPTGGHQPRAEEPHLYDLNGAAVDSLELTLNSYVAENNNPADN